jgi:gliding motility-associated-like protein
LLCFLPQKLFALEALGGEITWTCTGLNSFNFKLVLYRDCNSTDITGNSEIIRVWNHGTTIAIPVTLTSRVSITPVCTQNGGSLSPLDCGSGDNGGNGLGAVEKFTYESAAISISGIPPAEGWIFTYETTARKASLTNISNPAASGMTIVAKMFEASPVQNGCLDNSPQFLENPYLVVCSGTPYLYMPNVSDQDLDSLAFSLTEPLNNFPTGSFNPPVNPVFSTFNSGFSYTSPTPGVTINGSNSNFAIDPLTGDMSFTTVSPGEFVVKFKAVSYRNGRRIAEVEREMVVFVVDCAVDNNTAPLIGPAPELGGFQGSFPAGSLVEFTAISSDPEFLHDGATPQQNSSTVSAIVLAPGPSATGSQGSSNFVSWQSACADLSNDFGNEFTSVTYNFVVRVTDDYCRIPKVSYQRFQIELTSDVQLVPAEIQCIQTLATGDLIINWNQVNDPASNFVAYELHSVQSGLITSIPSISTTSFLVPAVNAEHDFFIKTLSGNPCTVALSSDTVSNMHLTLFNPTDGTAVLTWNSPFTVDITDFPGTYEIFREFPIGVFTSVGTLPFSTRQFIDTVDICSANINYYVTLSGSSCLHSSSFDGDLLSDRIAPFAPVISSLTIDTLTGFATLTWSQPNNSDIEGYVIYLDNMEYDTVYGLTNTSYTYSIVNTTDPLNFSVAAFDSCTSQFNPLFNQTSGRSEPHTSMFLSHNYDVCTRTVNLEWTEYIGWEAVDTFFIYGMLENGPWESFGFVTGAREFETGLQEFLNYTFAVQATEANGNNSSFSNKISFFTTSTSKPGFNYIRVATVANDIVEIHHEVELMSGVSALSLERMNSSGDFEEIQLGGAVASSVFYDDDVDVSEHAYAYRVRVIDSCGNPGGYSNIAQTMLLKVQTDQLLMTNFLSWSPYIGFNGSVLYYNVYRGIEGVFPPYAFSTVPADVLFFEDTMISNLDDFNGQICYYVEAVEAINAFGYREMSYSNTVCPVIQPLIYVPTAFTPDDDGINEIFKPVVDIFEISDYHFTVLDRWGQVIYQTETYEEGWDGKIAFSGKSAPMGVYSYVVQVKDGNLQEIIKRGHVVLRR